MDEDGIDPNLYEPTEPGFATINRILPAQQAFFQQTVRGMVAKPYADWTSLWVEPPDATCPATRAFESGSSAAWEVLPCTTHGAHYHTVHFPSVHC